MKTYVRMRSFASCLVWSELTRQVKGKLLEEFGKASFESFCLCPERQHVKQNERDCETSIRAIMLHDHTVKLKSFGKASLSLISKKWFEI